MPKIACIMEGIQRLQPSFSSGLSRLEDKSCYVVYLGTFRTPSWGTWNWTVFHNDTIHLSFGSFPPCFVTRTCNGIASGIWCNCIEQYRIRDICMHREGSPTKDLPRDHQYEDVDIHSILTALCCAVLAPQQQDRIASSNVILHSHLTKRNDGKQLAQRDIDQIIHVSLSDSSVNVPTPKTN